MLETEPTSAGKRARSPAAIGRPLPVGLAEALALFITLRLGLNLLALTLSAMEPLPPPCFHHGVSDWPAQPELVSRGLAFQVLGVWEKWDACWYLRIAEHGYGGPGSDQPTTAFFPLYPALTRVAGDVLGGRMVLGSLLVSGLAYIAAIVGLYRLVLRDFDRGTAHRTVVYLSVFPMALFFFAPFTESLFLATAVWAIYASRMRWWALACGAALLAGLTRLQGLTLVLPLAWEAFQALRAAFRSGERGTALVRRAATMMPAVAAAPAGFLLFYLYSATRTGMSTLEAQRRNWGNAWQVPWDVLARAWDWAFNQPDSPWRDQQVMVAFNFFMLLAFALLLVVFVRRLPLSYTLFAAPQIFVIVCITRPVPLNSVSRYLLVLFPVFVALALIGRQRWLDQGWLILSVLFLGFFTAAFLRNIFIA